MTYETALMALIVILCANLTVSAIRLNEKATACVWGLFGLACLALILWEMFA